MTAGSVLAGLVDLGGSIACGEPARTPRLVRSAIAEVRADPNFLLPHGVSLK